MDMCTFCVNLKEHPSANDAGFLRNAFSTLDHRLSKLSQFEREKFFQDDWAQILPSEYAAFLAALAEYVYLQANLTPPVWVNLYVTNPPSYGEFLGNYDLSDEYKVALETKAHPIFVKHGLYLSGDDVLNSY